MSIVLARIDDRLIHGQVMTSWLNQTGANKIIVIDDITANDKFLSMIIRTSVPANIKSEVVTIHESVDVINKIQNEEKVIILAKVPKPFLNLIENGIKLEWLNIGGMGIKSGRKTLYKNISASEEEILDLKKIISLGVSVGIQMVTEDSKVDVEKLI